MPARKRYTRKRAPRGKLTRLAKDVRMLKRVAIPEVKFIDTTVQTVSSTSLVKVPVSLIEQGDNSSQRDGDEILLKYLYLKGSITSEVGLGDATVDDHCRVIVLQDMQQDADGAIFSTLDFLQLDNWNSYYHADGNQKRFRVLSDKMIHLGRVGNTAGGEVFQATACSKYISLKIKLDRKLYFNGTSDTQASQGRGKIYVCYIGETYNYVIDLQARLTFQDS